ncbi:2-oxoglutarate dehydrogenase subunit E1 [Hypericibacter adhaerens]|uniref:2-oxoglutarate dehydrogenase E1 component n=1 Tax=Hypericibacter adhaerens TaxID=2602016 RepID=A0A5J6N7G0_9PROT|nr:2-oxoglutarate dehydrogenase E1 component [Hypericibacter adhaerens]QEX24763.1 2-oxoglutarate dehydrogenase subunit E1 [Hypericibacter adhaerens]
MQTDPTTFLSGPNATFIAELYARYLEDPQSVDASWRGFFAELADDAPNIAKDLEGASWAPRQNGIIVNGHDHTATAAPARENGATKLAERVDDDQIRAAATDSIRALMMIRAYRVRGHLEANLDPLQLKPRPKHSELDPASYGFTEADLDRPIFIDNVLGHEYATLRQIITILRETYCGNIGVEFMHIQDPEQKSWIQERIEGIRNQTEFTDKGKRAILERLTAAESFERFLDKKYTGTKRFGLDGGESMIPALEQIIKRGSQVGVKEFVIGMPHRGRLNTLANFMGKPFAAIFSEFQGNPANPEDVQGSADVKYHLGTSSDREFDGQTVHLSLTANPSHLEAVNTVVLGKVRAKQEQRGDLERNEVAAILLHGDAAFAGQGLVAETLDLSDLKGYRIGGTIHFIVNNQIGFTTDPVQSRSGPYCSEVAKIIQAPIFHVNGDDPEAVVHVSRIATEYRQRFKHDVVIDMFCYRRYGHNESDEPMFTQPLMYKRIAQMPTTRQVYAERLAREGVVSAADATAMVAEFQKRLDEAFENAKSFKPNKADWLEGAWSGLEIASGDDRRGQTAVPMQELKEIGNALCTVPQGFSLNRKIVRQLEAKRQAIESGEGIDWATAEALAFGSLLVEGAPVRLSGQDVGRGTFSQRHAVLIDQENEDEYLPVNNIREKQAKLEIIDSPLSEAGVLGFEYGYSLAEPRALVIWEAQFGDFANGAQVIVDQFISSGESKWLRMSGLVMLLPHGYEGQGPEHSSARLERYLQLCAEDNMQVVNCTTPSNYFHALRRQLHRNFRKPLIAMTPKSLLRHKLAVSKLDYMSDGTSFHRVLHDEAHGQLANDRDIRRVVLCSGKVYYDIHEEREKRGLKDIYILRLEQLYPFPDKALKAELQRFSPDIQITWCQEEPKNMGAWCFVSPEIERVMGEAGIRQPRLTYSGRPASASPATGLLKRHLKEQGQLVGEALGLTAA